MGKRVREQMQSYSYNSITILIGSTQVMQQ